MIVSTSKKANPFTAQGSESDTMYPLIAVKS